MNNANRKTINSILGLNAMDFLGNYLRKEDVSGEAIVRIIEVRSETVAGSNRQKMVAQFEEFEKPLILNATNIKRLCHLFGSKNTANWRGFVTLYVDELVEYAGTPVGGLRVKAAAGNGTVRHRRAEASERAYADESDLS